MESDAAYGRVELHPEVLLGLLGSIQANSNGSGERERCWSCKVRVLPKKNILILALWTHHNLLTVGPASTESMKEDRAEQATKDRASHGPGKDLVSTKIDAGLSQNYY